MGGGGVHELSSPFARTLHKHLTGEWERLWERRHVASKDCIISTCDWRHRQKSSDMNWLHSTGFRARELGRTRAQAALQLFVRGCKMRWKRFIWAGGVVVVILIFAPLAILPFSHDVAKEARDWIGAYSGISLIIAALIAAYPGFSQVDELKIANNRTRVDMISGIQSALRNENDRIDSVSQAVDGIVQLARSKQHADIMSSKRNAFDTLPMSVVKLVQKSILFLLQNIEPCLSG